jgi:acetyl esterase/lipase
MMSRRVVITAAVVAAVALAGVVVFAAVRSRSSEPSGRSAATTTTTVAPPLTTVAPQTIPVPPLPPAGPTTAPPPAITVPQQGGTVGTIPPESTTPAKTTPESTTPPTVTAAPPGTTKPPTSTTKPTTSTTKPGKVTRKTVVYTPPGAPKRRGELAIPRTHESTIVVLVHGGTDATTKKQMRGWADFYAQHGYASFAIDYLVATPTTPSPVYPKPETDVKAAVQFLRERAGTLAFDPDRIVVQGFSTGAALGAQALVTPNDPFFSGPGHFPNISDAPAAFIGFAGLYDGTQRDPSHYYGGPPDSPDPQVQERFAKANSIAQAAGAAGPALLYTGQEDDPAVVQSATSFRDALQSAGKDVTLTLVPGAGPSFDQAPSGALTPAGQQAAQQVLAWLQARFPPG